MATNSVRITPQHGHTRVGRPLLLFVAGALIALGGGFLMGLLGERAILPLFFLLFAVVVGALFVSRRYEILAVLAVVLAIVLDWFPFPAIWERHFHPNFALIFVCVVLAVVFLRQSRARPWIGPPAFGWWLLVLALGVYPTISALSVVEAGKYYADVLLSAAAFYLLGVQLGTSWLAARRILAMLSGFAALLAAHSIFFSLTGIFLFSNSGMAGYLVGYGNFRLPGSFVYRAGGFLLNPDWNGVFMATMLFVVVGLYLSSTTSRARTVYLIEGALVLVALLFTFSTASWLATAVGVTALVIFAGSRKARLRFLAAIGAGAVGLLVIFPSMLGLLLAHASNAREVRVRLGLWQTALNTAVAKPWSGIGFGLSNYTARAEPYRSVLQYRPYPQPHESYLELAAMGGIPLLLVFLLILALVLRRAWLNYRLLEGRERAMLGGAIAAVLAFSANALMINAWTLAPLTALIWLILGVISSPALASDRSPADPSTMRSERATASSSDTMGSERP
jgi:O-antigen ligase